MPLAPVTDSRHADRLLLVIGAVTGACVAWSRLAASTDRAGTSWLMVVVLGVVAAQGGAALFWVLRTVLRWLVGRVSRSHAVREAYASRDVLTYAVGLLTLSTAIGVQLVAPVVWTFIALFLAAQIAVLRRAWPRPATATMDRDGTALAGLFMVSGAAALIYQVAWQRSLFRYFGVNMEPVTIIVSIFMLGLGLGALAGGRLSRNATRRLPWLFVVIELGIGLFGVASLPLIDRVGNRFITAPLPMMAVAVYGLLAIPTFLMGATLPILVAWLDRTYHDVGRAVARLYFVNTLGSALACFLTVDLIFAFTGLRGATRIAAGGNLLVALLAAWIARRASREVARG